MGLNVNVVLAEPAAGSAG